MQVIVSTDAAGMVWITTTQGNRLTTGFFKAPDETPEELEHMGYPQLLHLYPPEEILVGPGIALEEVEEIFVEAGARAQHEWSAALGPLGPRSAGTTARHSLSE